MKLAQLRLAQVRGAEGVVFARRALEVLAPMQVSTSALLQVARNLLVACEEGIAFSMASNERPGLPVRD
jgi:3-polyprenyl-4-hydroxybenzoate decarboxylase